MIQKKTFILATIAALTAIMVSSQEIPDKPDPPRLVNDYAGILTQEENSSLEWKLENFSNSSSTQIVVVTVNDLGNYDAGQFAYEIGQKWGVGKKGKNNGVVLLVKPKTSESRGQAYISVAYGLEDTLTDALAKRIVEIVMIPRFKENNYYGGIDDATTAIIDVTKGKFKADSYNKVSINKIAPKVVFIILIIFIFIIAAILNSNKSNKHTLGRKSSNIPFWLLMGSMMGSSRSSGSSWGGFSSGGGGFGGFGGGSFGGGGAGGSW
jgi:uncharacterized protein